MKPAGLLVIVAVLVLSLPLVGCGKKGPPEPPGPADKITYPRMYPTR